LYGARAPEVLEEAGDDPSLRVSLSPDPAVETGLMGCEILYAFRREMAETLADALLRRTMVGLGPNVALDVDEAAASVAVEHLGWTEDRAREEVENFRRYIERYRPKSFREGERAGV
ncbi:MAG: FAD-dependent oxidoreductase, partial [Actinomycetota bacterium]|nr:FAD-dependent oxidoreductase [Actinomycetota bacterium]